MIGFIEVLRALATALVANSHFKGVYPSDILSFGGGFGLALFYMISGYLMANMKEDTRFSKWYFPKCLRLYIPLYLVRLLELLLGYEQINSFRSFFIDFIFPGSWFGGSMVILYVLYSVLVKYWLKGESGHRVGIVLGISAACYGILFATKPGIAAWSIQSLKIEEPFSVETPYLITQFVWLSCMVIGYWLRKTGVTAKKNYPMLGAIVFSVLVFLGQRLLTRNGQYMVLEVILGPVYIIFSLSAFLLLSKCEAGCQKLLGTLGGKLISIVSMCSLEIYYIQFMWIALLKDLLFPVNLILLFVAIITSAYAVHWLSRTIVKKIPVAKQ